VKRVAVLVSNDLVYDQRVRKTCATLQELGWEPTLVGRRMKRSDAEQIDRPYETVRLYLRAKRGAMFYAALNARLALWLWRRRSQFDLIWVNDLDTLWAGLWGASFAKSSRYGACPVCYDSHEWFTQAEGLVGRPKVRAIWSWIERRSIPRLASMMTVNAHIANAYNEQYGLKVRVLPNVPVLRPDAEPASRDGLGWPVDAPVMILQGAFMDRDRGALDAVRALVELPDWHLALVGAGPEFDEAPALAQELDVFSRLHHHPRMDYDRLRSCTRAADLGLSLDRPTADNFKFSLPNKLFDYVHAGLPVVVSDLPVAGAWVVDQKVGAVARSSAPGDIARAVLQAHQRVQAQEISSEHLKAVAQLHHWAAYRDEIAGLVADAVRQSTAS
jgi:glycosyltransferase involved in cell wall biosynthesis